LPAEKENDFNFSRKKRCLQDLQGKESATDSRPREKKRESLEKKRRGKRKKGGGENREKTLRRRSHITNLSKGGGIAMIHGEGEGSSFMLKIKRSERDPLQT